MTSTDQARKPRPTTWTAYEITPGGRERVLAEHLTYTRVLATRFPDAAWAVVWRQDTIPTDAAR